MMRRPDWCISRQRTWGVPLALFVHKETGELHPRTAELLDGGRRGSRAGHRCLVRARSQGAVRRGRGPLRQGARLLDVWADSGLSLSASRKRLGMAAGRADCIWKAPISIVAGFTVFAAHSVASAARRLTERCSPTASRWTSRAARCPSRSATSSYPRTSAPSGGRAAPVGGVHRLRAVMSGLGQHPEAHERSLPEMRNTTRSLLANLYDSIRPCPALPADKLLDLDRWLMAKAEQLKTEIQKAYREYQFHFIYGVSASSSWTCRASTWTWSRTGI